LLLRGEGEEVRGDDGGGDIVRDPLDAPERDPPWEEGTPCDGGDVRVDRSVLTTTGRSFLLDSRATRSKLRTDPRGTPSPAESRLIVSRLGAPTGGFAARPRPTMTVCRDRTGGCGITVRRGGFTTRGMAYQLFQ
jgi:hypothetical protein